MRYGYLCFSAGVGRTGAYIMIDALLDQAEMEDRVDALQYLHSLREDRPNMVQTEVIIVKYLHAYPRGRYWVANPAMTQQSASQSYCQLDNSVSIGN